jgi:hypothetical protein
MHRRPHGQNLLRTQSSLLTTGLSVVECTGTIRNDDTGTKVTLFVDDTSILITGKATQDLTLNLDKTIKVFYPSLKITG